MGLTAPTLDIHARADIERFKRAAYDVPLGLAGFVTADIPTASKWPYSWIYDKTAATPKFSDGSSWLTFSLSTHVHTAATTTFTPTGTVAATDVQAAIAELDTEKAALTGATFTGLVKSSSATAGVGYATGAGGTVTQATSKSTSVTINKVCGQITMNAAALAAGVSVTFSVSNSVITATDAVVLSLGRVGTTAAAYRLVPSDVTGGGFTITVTNVTAGSLSEAVLINFAIIKAVNA